MKRLVRNYVPLPHAKVKKIAVILTEAWEISPSQKAAGVLRAAGFTSDDLWRFGKTKTAKLQFEHWRNNTYNDMKDHEIANAEAHGRRSRTVQPLVGSLDSGKETK